jgi:ABC-2 type transport system ATP-binding protein
MALVLDNVCKSFRHVKAVQNLSLQINDGSMFGFLGGNGAGKTTTMRMILDIIKPDEGRILWNGSIFGRHCTGKYGYLPEERGLYPKMTVEEHLVFLGRLNGLSHKTSRLRTAEWLERFEIGPLKSRRIDELSKGNQQKVQVIATLLHDPEILFLDEPFAGLDPVNTSLLRSALREYNASGRTVIFSSHRMEQVEDLCQDICIIHEGRLIVTGALEQIKRDEGRTRLRLEIEGINDLQTHFPELYCLEHNGRYSEFRLTPEIDSSTLLTRAMKLGKVLIFELVEPSLEQIFISKVRQIQ